MTPAPERSLPGVEIGGYRLLAELARGGMGIVYLAARRGAHGFYKLVVIKELKPSLGKDPMLVGMFLDEARTAARMTHPNLVATYEAGSEAGRHYIVMEYLEGQSLADARKSLGASWPLGAYLRVIADLLAGLHYAHELRDLAGQPLCIVHRDVCPMNAFVTFDGQAKLLDFGMAKVVDSLVHTRVGLLKGRVAYMAPEQVRSEPLDRRVDVYAAGVMLWEAVAGRRLWPREMSEVDILMALMRGEPAPALRSVCPDAPADLEAICARAMAPCRDDRYSAAADLLADLENHLSRRVDGMTTRATGAALQRALAGERRKMRDVVERSLRSLPPSRSAGVVAVTEPAPSNVTSQRVELPYSARNSLTPNVVTASLSMRPSAQSVAGPRPDVASSAMSRAGVVAGGLAVLLLGVVLSAAVRPRSDAVPPRAPSQAEVAAIASEREHEAAPVVVSPVVLPAPILIEVPSEEVPAPRLGRPIRSPAASAAQPTVPDSAAPLNQEARSPPRGTERDGVDPLGGRARLRPIETRDPYLPP